MMMAVWRWYCYFRVVFRTCEAREEGGGASLGEGMGWIVSTHYQYIP